MSTLFWQFSYLQILDLLTTIAFLTLGVQEGNPLVRVALQNAPNPVIGLIAIKLAAVGMGLFCVWREKPRLLGRINLLFAIIVAWNLIALIEGAVRLSRAA